MKIAFNARLLSSPTLRGWNRYTINLLAELPRLGIELYLYSDKPIDPTHLNRLPQNSYKIRVSSSMRYFIWEQFWLPKQCKKDQVELLHCPINFGLPWSSSCPRLLTLHDAIDYLYYNQKAALEQQFNPVYWQSHSYHWIARIQADHIITVSQYSKADLVKYLHIPEHKITVTYEAADPHFHKPVSNAKRKQIRNQYQLCSPYIFYVGGWEKRKNIPFLIRAFAQANLGEVDLVLAGGSREQQAALEELATSLNISENLKLLGWVEDIDLPALYAEALCFVYPSEYEGFGLQLCEAMAVSCPVLAARTTCLPEILGDGGKTFELNQLGELEKLLVQVVKDENFRQELSVHAQKQSKLYSWRQTAIATKNLYSKTIDNFH
jgi:glycosyltransferase involved in cell wall biosynthesis